MYDDIRRCATPYGCRNIEYADPLPDQQASKSCNSCGLLLACTYLVHPQVLYCFERCTFTCSSVSNSCCTCINALCCCTSALPFGQAVPTDDGSGVTGTLHLLCILCPAAASTRLTAKLRCLHCAQLRIAQRQAHWHWRKC